MPGMFPFSVICLYSLIIGGRLSGVLRTEVEVATHPKVIKK
jgi:hypothetical protein